MTGTAYYAATRGEGMVKAPWPALLAGVLLVVSGCAAGGAPAPAASPADLINVLHRSMLDDTDLKGVGLDPAKDTGLVKDGQINADPERPCRTKIKSDVDRRKAVQTGYDSPDIQVLHRAFSYRSVSGADVVAQIKKVVTGCDTYQIKTERGNTTYTVNPTVPLPELDGLDAAYAYCEQGVAGQWLWWVCHLQLASGRVVSTLRVNGATEERTQQVLAELAPAAAHLLIKATGSGS